MISWRGSSRQRGLHMHAGVLQVEAMAQLGGICMLDPEAPSKDQFFFGGIEKCRFKKPVVPGDTLVGHCPVLGLQRVVPECLSAASSFMKVPASARCRRSHRPACATHSPAALGYQMVAHARHPL